MLWWSCSSCSVCVCMNPLYDYLGACQCARSHECKCWPVCVWCALILDVAAGRESLWCVTKQLIIIHSAPHTVKRKRGVGGGEERRRKKESGRVKTGLLVCSALFHSDEPQCTIIGLHKPTASFHRLFVRFICRHITCINMFVQETWISGALFLFMFHHEHQYATKCRTQR